MRFIVLSIILLFFVVPVCFAAFGGNPAGQDQMGQGGFSTGAFGEKVSSSGGSTPNGTLLYLGNELTYLGATLTYNP